MDEQFLPRRSTFCCDASQAPWRHVMRLFLLHALMIAAALGSISSAAAEGRYCLQGGTWGYPGNCQFSTYHQCKMSASGTISIAASTLDMLIIAIHRANQA